MNVFVLCTGRCGSVTFNRACQHITNYTSAHESRAGMIGKERFNFAANHIEVDNRLSWFLGRLDQSYGRDAFYVHLSRDLNAVATSYSKRSGKGIMRAYKSGVLIKAPRNLDDLAIATDYCHTIDSNIRLFLRDKPNKMEFKLENCVADFGVFWEAIGAQGDLDAAIVEWGKKYNPSGLKGFFEKVRNKVS